MNVVCPKLLYTIHVSLKSLFNIVCFIPYTHRVPKLAYTGISTLNHLSQVRRSTYCNHSIKKTRNLINIWNFVYLEEEKNEDEEEIDTLQPLSESASGCSSMKAELSPFVHFTGPQVTACTYSLWLCENLFTMIMIAACKYIKSFSTKSA